MKNAIVRFAALYVFTVVVLLLIGMLMGGVSVGIHALWAGVILTLAALFIKPALSAAAKRSAAKSAAERTKIGQKTVQYALVYVVELVIWALTVWLSSVRVSSFWGYALPPLILLVGWMIYDQIDDRMRATASGVYDSMAAKVSGKGKADAAASAPAPDSDALAEGRAELDDGLTPEQRRMLDELG